MMSLRAFLPATEKVRQVELHPTQPWLASCTKADHISVWDWSSQQMLADFQLGGPEDQLLRDIDVARASGGGGVGQQDKSFKPNPSLSEDVSDATVSPLGSRQPTGKVRDIKFLDLDVAQSQLSSQHYLVNGPSSFPPCAQHITALAGKRLLVIVCENKVLLYDLMSRRMQELPRSSLDLKAPTCVGFLFQGGQALPGALGLSHPGVMRRPVMAFGCSDGIVRLVLLLPSFPLVMRLSSSHKSSIQCITVTQSRGLPWEQVVVGHSHGSLASWEPFHKALSNLSLINKAAAASSSSSSASSAAAAALAVANDISCKAEVKAHDKEVIGLVLACYGEDPDRPKRLLFTAGVDNRLVGWDSTTLKDVCKAKLDAKANTTSMSYSPRGFASSGAHTLLVGTEIGVLLSFQVVTGSMKMACNLQGMIPTGTKKQPKIYWVCPHPNRSDLVALGTNTGACILTVDQSPPLPACPLPLRSPLQALSLPLRASALALASNVAVAQPWAPGSGSGITFICTYGPAISCVTCVTVEQQASALQQARGGKADEDTLTLDTLLSLDEENKDKERGSNQSPNSPAHRPGVKVAQGDLAWHQAQIVSKVAVGTGVPSQRAVVSCSHDGAFISVIYPFSKHYSIYRQGALEWEEIDQGDNARSIAWQSGAYRFAVLEGGGPSSEPSPAAAPPSAKGNTPSPPPLSTLSTSPSYVHVKEVQPVGGGSRGVVISLHRYSSSHFNGIQPCNLTSGPLLGITLDKEASFISLDPLGLPLPSGGGGSGSEMKGDLIAGDKGGKVMQFITWEGGQAPIRVGHPIPEPLVSAWDPGHQYLALGYSAQVVFCLCRKSPPGSDGSVPSPLDPLNALSASLGSGQESQGGLEVHGSPLPITEGPVINMVWAMRQLYILTPTQIRLVFMGSSGPTLHALTLASFHDSPSLNPGQPSPPLKAPSLSPLPALRPPGTLVMLGPRDGSLWLLNTMGQALALDLSHPGLLAMSLLACGDESGAVAVAQSKLDMDAQDDFALLSLHLGYCQGHPSSPLLQLPGLKLVTEARMRLVARQWRHAAECIEALLSGLDRRPFSPGSNDYCLSASIFGLLKPSSTAPSSFGPPTPSLVYRGGGGFTNLGYSFSSTAPPGTPGPEPDHHEGIGHQEPGNPLIPTMRNPGPPFADEIDWTLPLRAPSLSPSPSPGGGGYASYPRINPLAARLGVALTKSCTRSVLCPQRWQGASLGLEMLESMIPAGLGKEAGAFSLPLISLLSSATPSPHTSHGDLVALRTRLILALASGGSATREALREATISFALEGGGDGSLSGHSGLGSGLFSLAPFASGGNSSLALLSSLMLGPAVPKSKIGLTTGRYITPLDPSSQDQKEEGEEEEDYSSRLVALMARGEASLAALNASLKTARLPAAALLSSEEGTEGDRRARALAAEKEAVDVWQGLLENRKAPGPHLTTASTVY